MQKADVSPVKLLHEIVAACLEYQPTFSLFGRQLTYQDAFSGEISRIVSLPLLKGLFIFFTAILKDNWV